MRLYDPVKWSANKFHFILSARFFVGYGLELSRLVPLIIYHLKCKFLIKTDKELEEAWAPGPFTYETLVPSDMLIVMISLAYSVIAPLILLFAILYFGIGWIVLRNQVLHFPNTPAVVNYQDINGVCWMRTPIIVLSATCTLELCNAITLCCRFECLQIGSLDIIAHEWPCLVKTYILNREF